MATATLTSKGQVTIPKEVRDRMGLRPGDKIAFLETAGDDVIMQRKRPVSELFGLLSHLGVRLTPEQIDEAIMETMAEKHDRS